MFVDNLRELNKYKLNNFLDIRILQEVLIFIESTIMCFRSAQFKGAR